MMTSAFSEMFNDCLHAYQDKYDSAESLRRALLGNGVTFGVRGLDFFGKDMPMFNADSVNNDGAFHQEIFYDDTEGNLHSVGYFKGGMRYDTEISGADIKRYSFEPVQYYKIGPMITFYWQQPNFNANNYNAFTHNCQDYAEHMRGVLELKSYI